MQCQVNPASLPPGQTHVPSATKCASRPSSFKFISTASTSSDPPRLQFNFKLPRMLTIIILIAAVSRTQCDLKQTKWNAKYVPSDCPLSLRFSRYDCIDTRLVVRPTVLTEIFSNLQHMMTHAAPRPFVCDVCDAGFTTSAQLASHSSSHLVPQQVR